MLEEEQPHKELGEEEDEEESEAEKENVPNNIVKKAVPGQPLGNIDEKEVLKKAASKKPTTQKLVDEAIKELNERGGSSAEAIRKFIMNKNPDMVEDRLKIQIKRYIKNCLTDGTMMQIKRSFKFTNKHMMKKNPMETKKLNDKKEKQKIKEKAKVKEQKLREKKKAKDAKAPKKEKSSDEKLKDKTKETKKPKEENTKAKNKVDKVTKLDNVDVSAKTTNSKNMQKTKSKNKISRKSINLVVRPTSPRPKTMKKPKTTVAIAQKKVISPAAKSGDPAASTSATVKATGRGRKK